MFHRFLPDIYINSVTELTPPKLKELGIKNLLVDVDCTLKSYKQQEVSAEILEWIRTMKESGIGLCLLSNGLGRRISKLAHVLSLPYVAPAMKPSSRGCYRALQENNFQREETAIVGDQLFSDVWAGRRTKLFTIRVRPLHPEQEPWFAQFKRPLEWLLLHFFPPKYQ